MSEHDGAGDDPIVVGPNPRLLLVLIVLLVGAALAIVLTGGEDDAGELRLGPLPALAEQASGGPIALAALPHLVVTRTATLEPVYDPRWGDATGAVLLTPFDQIVVLDVTDPQDGATVVWCAAANAFRHPGGERWFATDGRLLTGDGRRGLDRRALSVVGGDQVEVDDNRWVKGQARTADQTVWTPRGDCTEAGSG